MKRYLTVLFVFCATLSVFGQQVPSNIVGQSLPCTWEQPFMGGKMVCTMMENGTIYSQSITPCYLCSGGGVCQVCYGTGGQYWYGMGIQPCGRCSGSGRCATCYGKGFSIMNFTQSRFGGSIGYDEHGNCYVSSTVGGGSRGSGRQPSTYNCCSGVPTFGLPARSHRCNNCGDYHTVGNHKCLRR